ncbi:MAG: phosphopentomutase [Spirochaetales bacterium]|nr:phosphopentomutase [Spirochaetales bacterium]
MKAILLVIDSFGIGALPDADKYGDYGANTALHICEAVTGDKWPNLRKMGLGNASEILGNTLPGCLPVERPSADFGVMAEKSPGKDTTTGHWELAGIVLETPFTVFPPDYPSFPDKLTMELSSLIGRDIIGNKSASGTEIIKELGDEHMITGSLICYTSADSVFQIAAEESIISPEDLYSICSAAREVCDKFNIGRIIARPFVRETDGSFRRTSRRRDFSIALPEKTVMDRLQSQKVNTIGIGKIGDIFNEQGLNESFHDKGNEACLNRLVSCMKHAPDKPEFLFVNLVDTDMLYGHRRDVRGYHDCVEYIDSRLPEISELLGKDDVLILTADHGCDPAFRGTDHTREYVPLLIFRIKKEGINLGKISSFSFIADYIHNLFSEKLLD